MEQQGQGQPSTENGYEIVQPEFSELTALVHRGMAGDREVLPAIRRLLDQTPALWEEARSLATQVERAWIQVLAGDNLVTQEILERQVGMLKVQLAGAAPTPLEQLLVERIAVCWLQMQHAELQAATHVHQANVRREWDDRRLDKVQQRFLLAVKALAQVRKLLRPGTAVQVNIAQQQVNLV
jgi:hypothetical protein